MSYYIKIPKPCHEKWNEMTPTEKGVFCSKCRKEVLDFTCKTNYELARLLDNSQNICGKFRPEQLNIEFPSLKNRQKTNVGWFLGLSAMFSLTLPLFAQSKLDVYNKIEKTEHDKKESLDNFIATDSIQIRGQVLDSAENYGMPGVTIVLKGYHFGTSSDFDGNFSLSISEHDIKHDAVLVFSYLGYIRQERKIYPKTEFLKIEMMVDEDNALMGEVIIIKKQNIFRRVGNLFRRKK